MPYGFYISAGGANAQMRRMEVIANNMANVDTVGFKPDQMVFKARFSEAIEQGKATPWTGSLEDVGGGVSLDQVVTKFGQGPLKATGGKLDIAIEGNSFFLVQDGEDSLLTRAGNFSLTSDGTVVNQGGRPVLDDGGTPIQLDPLQRWEVMSDGSIRQGEDQFQLAMVKPTSLRDLVKKGENLFELNEEPTPTPIAERRVKSGFLEMSGVNSMLAMTEMIETTRAMEMNINMMKNHDEMIGGLISRVLKV